MKNNYPESVSKHLKPGIYVNRVKDTYYLYYGKAVYNKETKKTTRITNGTYGRVDANGVFHPSKILHQEKDEIRVYEFGIYRALIAIGGIRLSAVSRYMKKYQRVILVGALLKYCHGYLSNELYNNTYFSLESPSLDFNKCPQEVISEIERTAMKARELMKGENVEQFKYIYLVKVKDKLFVSSIDEKTKQEAILKGIDLSYEKE